MNECLMTLQHEREREKNEREGGSKRGKERD